MAWTETPFGGGRLAVAGVALLSAILLAACGSSSNTAGGHPGGTASTGANTTPTSSTAPAPPPAPAYAPTTAQPSPDAAAALLVHDWADNNRAAAAAVAAPAAVGALFASPFPGPSEVQSRGCTDTNFPPVVCSYGPTGGASPNLALYQINVASGPTGWYVTTVQVES